VQTAKSPQLLRDPVGCRRGRLLRALATGDTTALSGFLGSPREAKELLAAWRAAASARGGLRHYAVLGTLRLDRRAFLTTVRLRFGRAAVTARFEWAGEQPVAHSGDLNAPTLAGPFRISPIPSAVVWPYPLGHGLFATISSIPVQPLTFGLPHESRRTCSQGGRVDPPDKRMQLTRASRRRTLDNFRAGKSPQLHADRRAVPPRRLAFSLRRSADLCLLPS
jgi:hypothetical protein